MAGGTDSHGRRVFSLEVAADDEDVRVWLPLADQDDAEQESAWPKAHERLLNNMINLAVDRRRTVGTILTDPGITRYVPDNKSFRRVMTRMNRLLMGTEPGPDAAIRTATLIAAISGTAIRPSSSTSMTTPSGVSSSTSRRASSTSPGARRNGPY